ncbi:hypothetical protein MtrunA17_Chr1g0180901 [Medicago truncatula]|uniref:Transmembrane protein n=1 Tax=Medicago truncatula TaxID=3880 RepID=A0A396JU83_MEDTR|nr:hypothetical protein MtrunA17_Chr1g0180901 [Medicago truncatula]
MSLFVKTFFVFLLILLPRRRRLQKQRRERHMMIPTRRAVIHPCRLRQVKTAARRLHRQRHTENPSTAGTNSRRRLNMTRNRRQRGRRKRRRCGNRSGGDSSGTCSGDDRRLSMTKKPLDCFTVGTVT